MATTSSTQLGTAPKLYTATPEKYTTIGTLLDPTKLDARDYLVKTYGDQGITGFLTLTGAVKNAGTADFVRWYEEGRRHKTFSLSTATSFAQSTTAGTVVVTIADANASVQVQDVVMNATSGQVFICTASSSTAATFKLLYGHAGSTADNTDFSTSDSLIILGNMYAEGTDQPANFYDTTLNKYDNNYMIIKEVFKVTGSQATNIGYVNVGNGDYRWYIHGENEARKRFMDKREMMMLFADFNTGALSSTPGNVAGSEGYFSAVKKRGITVSGADASPLDTIAEFDSIIIELDKQGAPSEYAMYLNRKQSLAIDDMLASGIATQVTAGLPGQFGAFNNSPDMAVQLGFKSFTRGGYTFHKHDWKLLNDPTLLGATAHYQGAMIPMTMVADAKTGVKAPALELNYKAANGYSREIEHWVTGSILGFNNTTKDEAVFNYRSEVCLVTRAANQHVAITK
jgi:hypothetical protein